MAPEVVWASGLARETATAMLTNWATVRAWLTPRESATTADSRRATVELSEAASSAPESGALSAWGWALAPRN